MDISQALAMAANIMLLGMVCVFSFLGMLVIAVNLVAKFCPEEAAIATVKPGTNTNNQVSESVVAAISAAVHQYRSSRGKPQDK
ncbi:MAG: OadG family protein [Gammaproteobacteria bacterium]|nr:OadG family protein [Gammaproteobacteria bacterium]